MPAMFYSGVTVVLQCCCNGVYLRLDAGLSESFIILCVVMAVVVIVMVVVVVVVVVVLVVVVVMKLKMVVVVLVVVVVLLVVVSVVVVVIMLCFIIQVSKESELSNSFACITNLHRISPSNPNRTWPH
jgi:energy-coupling factor transporter transmembrane protein EcfT